MELKLSILVATMPSRKELLDSLLGILHPQINNREAVELIIDYSMDYNIGTKRNKLLEKAEGEYIVYIDDDDHISDNYIELILKVIDEKPDCIGICGIISTNGGNIKKWFISKQYKKWYEEDNIYYRTPNHISPVKREIAMKAMFPEIHHGEDFEYSMRILPFLIKEIIIEQELYHYDYKTNK